MATQKRRRYSDEERATLMAMLESEGYPDRLGALKKVADYAQIHPHVLRRWWKAKQNPPPHKLVAQKKIDLREAIQSELTHIFTELHSKREDASYKDLGTVAGIMMDKLQLLEGKPTERISHDVTISDTERRARIDELLDRARTRRTGNAAETGTRRTDD